MVHGFSFNKKEQHDCDNSKNTIVRYSRSIQLADNKSNTCAAPSFCSVRETQDHTAAGRQWLTRPSPPCWRRGENLKQEVNLNQLQYIRCHHHHPLFRWNIIIVVSHSISCHPRLSFDGADDWMLDGENGVTGTKSYSSCWRMKWQELRLFHIKELRFVHCAPALTKLWMYWYLIDSNKRGRRWLMLY